MATGQPQRYDGARNKFIVPVETLKQNAERMQMTPDEYKSFLNKFVEDYSRNALFAYQHTDLGDVPITLDYPSWESRSVASGSYYPETGDVRISPNKNQDEMIRALVHELSHAANAKNPDWNTQGNFSRANLRSASKGQPGEALYKLLEKAGLTYGVEEPQAFVTETRHPYFKGKGVDSSTPLVSKLLFEIIAKEGKVADKYYGDVAQPTRPATSHIKGEPEWSISDRLLNLMLGYQPKVDK